MDRLEAMQVFCRVVERRSFTAAASDLGLPRSTVTDAVKQLEARLGVALLHRTTRHVRPTPDGEAYHRHCVAVLAEIDETEAMFSGARPKGLLRIDVNATLAAHFVLPQLPAFLAEYPDIELFIGVGDRLVDLVREGIDCVLRVGELADSDMVARRIGLLEEITCASPAYLNQHGTPTTLDDLAGHRMVGFHSTATGAVLPLEFTVGEQVHTLRLPTTATANGAECYADLGRLGLGLIQVPRYHVEDDLARGALVPVLPRHPPLPSPVSLLYPRTRQLALRVRVFVDWIAALFDHELQR